jgi:hypothetical protein
MPKISAKSYQDKSDGKMEFFDFYAPFCQKSRNPCSLMSSQEGQQWLKNDAGDR